MTCPECGVSDKHEDWTRTAVWGPYRIYFRICSAGCRWVEVVKEAEQFSVKKAIERAVKRAYFKMQDERKEDRRRQYEELKKEFE